MPPSTASRGRDEPPTLREPSIRRRREPTNGDTPAGIVVTRRRKIGEAVHNGQASMGQTQQTGAGSTDTCRHEDASPLRSTGRPFPSNGPPICGRGTRRTLNTCPSRSRAMASILKRAIVRVRRVPDLDRRLLEAERLRNQADFPHVGRNASQQIARRLRCQLHRKPDHIPRSRHQFPTHPARLLNRYRTSTTVRATLQDLTH